MHHTGSQEEATVAVPEDQCEVEQQEIPAQEVQVDEELGQELQECSDHRLSSFEKGKPRSISPYGLQLFNIASFMFDALSK